MPSIECIGDIDHKNKNEIDDKQYVNTLINRQINIKYDHSQ